MLKEIESIKESIEVFRIKYGESFKDYEIYVLETEDEDVNWKEYLEWKALINKKRILMREVRSIEDRHKKSLTDNGF